MFDKRCQYVDINGFVSESFSLLPLVWLTRPWVNPNQAEVSGGIINRYVGGRGGIFAPLFKKLYSCFKSIHMGKTNPINLKFQEESIRNPFFSFEPFSAILGLTEGIKKCMIL